MEEIVSFLGNHLQAVVQVVAAAQVALAVLKAAVAIRHLRATRSQPRKASPHRNIKVVAAAAQLMRRLAAFQHHHLAGLEHLVHHSAVLALSSSESSSECKVVTLAETVAENRNQYHWQLAPISS